MNVPHRPYSRIKGSEPSVTTILDLLPKPGLPWGAAKESAIFSVLHLDKWAHLPTNDAIDTIRRHHRGVWDGRAAFGTLVHSINECYCRGESVDLEELVLQTMEDDRNAREWKSRDFDDLLEQCLGYVLGLEKFWLDFQPSNVRSEVVVRWPGLYIGQTDLRCDWGLLDLKTTAKQDEDEGIYLDSWTLQLAAYGMARESVDYGLIEDKKLKSGYRVVETGTAPWSRPERYGVVHLRGDENYTLYDIPVTRRDERTFVRLARAYAGWKQIPSQPQIVRQEVVV